MAEEIWRTGAGVVRWAVNTSLWKPTDLQLNAYVALLPPSEWSSVLRCINREDRKRAVVSRLMQRKLVHSLLGIDYDSVRIERTPQGKPYLANAAESAHLPNLNFNVSHHGDYVVLVADPVSPVGVDVMTHDTRFDELPEDFFKPFASYFTEYEWKTIRSAGHLFDQFYRHWCMKEAYVKAVGIGLGFELQRAEFHYHEGLIWGDRAHVYIDGEYTAGWQFFLHKLDPDHWVSFSVPKPGSRFTPCHHVLDSDVWEEDLRSVDARYESLMRKGEDENGQNDIGVPHSGVCHVKAVGWKWKLWDESYEWKEIDEHSG